MAEGAYECVICVTTVSDLSLGGMSGGRVERMVDGDFATCMADRFEIMHCYLEG